MESSQSNNSRPRESTNLPFIVEPTSAHTYSFILLHGLSSNGAKFGKEFLDTGISLNGQRLDEIFPGARFIFPTSKRRRSSAFNRAKLTQWFDIASLDDPSYRSHTQLQGLEDSFQDILNIITDESKKIPRTKIILGGLSQGCAMALTCLLALEYPIGGFIGMSGWMPFRQDIEDLLNPSIDQGLDDNPCSWDENPFDSTGSSEDEVQGPAAKVLKYVQDLVAIERKTQNIPQTVTTTPVFLGHGVLDEKIKHSLGEDACRVMRLTGFLVDWRSYLDQGHWYKIPDEIDDIVEFIRTKVG